MSDFTIDNGIFAKNLVRCLRTKDLTQSEVADRMWGRAVDGKGALVARGRDRLSVWCAGKAFPSRENLALLAKALDVPETDLVRLPHHGGIAADEAEVATVDSSQHPGKTMLRINKLVPSVLAHRIALMLAEADAEKGK